MIENEFFILKSECQQGIRQDRHPETAWKSRGIRQHLLNHVSSFARHFVPSGRFGLSVETIMVNEQSSRTWLSQHDLNWLWHTFV